MQTLYALSRDQELNAGQAADNYNQLIEQSYRLYLFHLYLMKLVILHAEKDEHQRSVKHLPSREDQMFKAVLAANPVAESIIHNPELSREFDRKQIPGLLTDTDIIKKCYHNFSKQDEYITYYCDSDHSNSRHIDMLLLLYRTLAKDDLFRELTEDKFNNFIDDESLIAGAMKKSIRAMPDSGPFFREYLPDQETVEDFGASLLALTIEKQEQCIDVIKPRLINWEMDRVAVIDMILLQMAVIELLYFPSIPTKVTLNEYIDLSKMYSTDKSKDFVNGILDRLINDLNAEGKINKQGRGLVD